VLGRHQGIWHYTIGQRKGLGALGKRMFVKEIRPETNQIVAAENHQLLSWAFTVERCILHPDGIRAGAGCLVQVRYRSQAVACTIAAYEAGRMRIVLDQPQRAIAPGQSAVLYDGETVLGGGVLPMWNPGNGSPDYSFSQSSFSSSSFSSSTLEFFCSG
ncbi:MAG: aminomethyltransferase beta-barrel domain-containing protein, partial [Chitinivibrionales bacterium]